MEFETLTRAQQARLFIGMRDALGLRDDAPQSAEEIGLDALAECIAYAEEPGKALILGEKINALIVESGALRVSLDVSSLFDEYPRQTVELALRLNSLRKVGSGKAIRWTNAARGEPWGQELSVSACELPDL